jgi:methylphosphotriester-DNA--protein-cysteine methyltransferase
MSLLTHKKPAPPLSDFIDLFWLCEGYDTTHQKERLLPDGTVELVINLREDCIPIFDPHDPERFYTIPGCVVAGPSSEFFIIDTASAVSTIGVHFKPGGAFPFFRVPPAELSNQSVALECLWGAASARLRERLLMASTAEQKFRVLEACLLEQLAKPLERHPAVHFALQQFCRSQCPRAVSDVAGAVGFSHRHFIQLFSNEVGLSPKLFARVRRFQNVVRTTQPMSEVDCVRVALDCGYYDQAHFNHDFSSFAGITPMQYLERRTAHVNHVPMKP